ncbi:MAG: peptidoglycan editing factor PgeF [Bacilli bacterium]
MEPFQQGQDLQFHLRQWEERWPWLSSGMTSRMGGVSTAPYGSANYALHVGDQDVDVLLNRQKLCQQLSIPFESWTSAEQIHGATIYEVEHKHRGKGSLNREEAIQDTDGLVTKHPGVLLTAYYADCVPLYFIDPVNRIVGLAHAGWKGTVQEIATKMVDHFQHVHHSSPEHLHVAIGPAIGGCCYEVNGTVMDAVKQLPITFNDEMVVPVQNHREHYNLNLKLVNRELLIHYGINPAHILTSDWCTKCHNHFFYSYRNEFGKTGRHCAWMAIKEV